MSARTAPAKVKAISVRQHGNWTAISRAYFHRLFRVFTGLEMGVLGNIQDEQEGGGKDPLAWVAISYPTFAARLGAHVNGVTKAIAILEASGAIESISPPSSRRPGASGKAGVTKKYRCAVENWETLNDRVVPKEYAADKEPGSAGSRVPRLWLDKAHAAIADHDCKLAHEIVAAATEPDQEVADGTPTLGSGGENPAGDPPTPTPESGGSGFEAYIGVFLAHGKEMTPLDVDTARKLWDKLTFDQRVATCKEAAIRCDRTEDQRYIPLPANFIHKKPWLLVKPPRIAGPTKPPTKAASAAAAAASSFLAGDD